MSGESSQEHTNPPATSSVPSPFAATRRVGVTDLPEPQNTRVYALLDTALDAYKTFRYANTVRVAVQATSCPGATPKQKADAYILAGAAFYLRGNQGDAVYYFRKAKECLPGARPNPEMFPEAVMRLFDKAGN